MYHVKLVNILTEYDRKQSKRETYNRHALGHYMRAIGDVTEALDKGEPIEKALKRGFCGSLLCHVAKKLGVNHQYNNWE